MWSLCTLAADATGELDVLGHDCDALCVDGTEIDVLKEADEIGLSSFLQSEHSGGLEAEVGLEVLCYLAHETLEGQLADEKLGGFLVLPYLSQSHRARSVALWLLHAACCWRALPGGLGGELLARGLAAGTFACSLLRPRHLRAPLTTLSTIPPRG